MSGSNMVQELGKDELISSLRRLDELIGGYGLPDIRIRAVGGFALILRDLRHGGVTRDIDTITPDYPPEIYETIQEVALENGLEPNWINNQAVMSEFDSVTDDDVLEHDGMLNAKYEDFDLGLSHIKLEVADLSTLARAKLFAVASIVLGDRTTKDAKDLENIITALGFKGIRDASRHLEWMNDPAYADGLDAMRRFENGEDIEAEPYDLKHLLDDIHAAYSEYEQEQDSPETPASYNAPEW